jgi:hypothetical protein
MDTMVLCVARAFEQPVQGSQAPLGADPLALDLLQTQNVGIEVD